MKLPGVVTGRLLSATTVHANAMLGISDNKMNTARQFGQCNECNECTRLPVFNMHILIYESKRLFI